MFEYDEGHVDARRLLAQLNFDRGDLQQAFRNYRLIAEQFPDDVESQVELVRIAFASNQWEAFQRYAERVVDLAPDDPRSAIYSAGLAYRAAVDGAEGLALDATAAQALALLDPEPENARDTRILRAIVMDNSVRTGDLSGALAQIDRLLETEPDNKLYNRQKLEILVNIGDRSGIEEQRLSMVERFPDETDYQADLIRFYLFNQEYDKVEDFLRGRISAAEGEPGPALDLVRFLSEIRGFDAAMAELDVLIASNEDPDVFRVVRAGLVFSDGNIDEGIADLEELVASAEPGPVRNRARVLLAKMQLAVGNEVGARAGVEEVLTDDPTNPEALKMRADWLIASDETDGAISDLRSALQKSPEDAAAMSLLADAYARSGAPELARDFYGLAVEASGNAPAESLRYAQILLSDDRTGAAEDILIASLRNAPNNLDLLNALGELYLRTEDWGRAEQVIDAFRRLDSDAARAAGNQLEANMINRRSGPEELVGFLENLAEAEGAEMSAKLALIRAKLSTGDVAAALDSARAFREADPDDENATAVLAATLTAAGELDEAKALYQELLGTQKQRPAIWVALSRVQLRMADREGARATIEEGLSHLPDNPQLQWAMSSFLEADGDIDGAIAVYEEMYARNSSALIVANNLASLLSTHRDDAESLERAWIIARRFSELEIPAVQDTYGWILFRRGEVEEAITYLEPAAAALTADPVVQYHLGKAYLSAERRQEALSQMQLAIDLAGPEDQRAQIVEARQLLLSLTDEIAAPTGDTNSSE